jgi:hypothetical protein
MKSVAPGVFTANFSDFGAETSAFCNHAAQIAQVADEANISIFEREGRARTKSDGSRRLTWWVSKIEDTKITCTNCRMRDLARQRIGRCVKSFPISCPAGKELNGQEKL